ncbi:MAG: cyclic peptide export ABC transporter [Methylovulum sp.]|nr:cyclic peptide export ABC transporter [Methylovulum sp.]
MKSDNPIAQLKLLDFLIMDTPHAKAVLVAASIVCGVINALILVILNAAAKDFDNPELDARLFIIFLSSIALFFLSKRYITHRISRVVQASSFEYRGRILTGLRNVKPLTYEEIGKAEILAVLSEKTELISQGAHRLADGFPAVIMLVCSFAYIATLSKMAFLLSAICIVCSVISTQIMLVAMKKTLKQALAKEAEYVGYMQHVLDGFNELKINREKSADLCNNYMGYISEEAMQKNIETDISIANLQMYAQIYFYILMAGIVFLLPQLSELSAADIMAITTAVLYIIGPIVVVLDMIPSVAKANVAVVFLQNLELKLAAAQESVADERVAFKAPDFFRQLVISQVRFAYHDQNQSQGFSVGPFNLTINRGELIFIRGGNGSGKSTFLKLLTGLYEPESGAIIVDKQTIDSRLLMDYRNLFAIIFTDFHLFDRFYGHQDVAVDSVNEYLTLMGLEQKTGFKNGRFINANLSTGQKKRLALIIALLEDKSIYVFDEVAADQDPEFRQFFYDVILQKLKHQGKTVIVVTHDEKYFTRCDRLFIMDTGRMTETRLDK